MAIVRHCGKSDLFITMTYSPLWPEITAELLLSQTAQDYSDLVARVFKLKLTVLLHNLTKNMVFRKGLASNMSLDSKSGVPPCPHSPDT